VHSFRVLLFLIVLTLSPQFRSEAFADLRRSVSDCDSTDWQRRVAGCTRLLGAKKWPNRWLHVIYLQRAQGYLLLKDPQKAFDDFNTSLRFNPNSSDALRGRGAALNRLGRYDDALRDAEAAIRFNSADGFAHHTRGLALLFLGQPDTAMEALNFAISVNQNDPDVLIDRASIFLAKGNIDLAIEDLSSALRLNPRYVSALSGRCYAYALKQDYRSALKDCSEAVTIDSKDFMSYINRANVFLESGELDRALSDANSAIAIEPNAFPGFVQRSFVNRKIGNFTEALEDLDRAAKLNPQFAGTFAQKGLILETIGEVDAARTAYGKALALPDNTALVVKSGISRYDSTRYKAVAKARLVVVQGFPNGAVSPASFIFKNDEVTTDRILKNKEVTTDRRIALVVGNSAYARASKLINPTRDAKLLASSLRALKFEVSELSDGDFASMQRAITDFLRAASNASTAVVFYAGHGIHLEGQNFLVPTDFGTRGTGVGELIGVDHILTGLDDGQRTNVIFLDACRNNPFAEKVASATLGRSSPASPGLTSPSALPKGVASGAGTLLAFATAPGQVALDGDGDNSPFSTALNRHIVTPGLEVQQMLTRVRAEVVTATKARQVPWSNSSLLGEVFLSPAL
jgi:tetratricopeptide (TPR) repeat protein